MEWVVFPPGTSDTLTLQFDLLGCTTHEARVTSHIVDSTAYPISFGHIKQITLHHVQRRKRSACLHSASNRIQSNFYYANEHIITSNEREMKNWIKCIWFHSNSPSKKCLFWTLPLLCFLLFHSLYVSLDTQAHTKENEEEHFYYYFSYVTNLCGAFNRRIANVNHNAQFG